MEINESDKATQKMNEEKIMEEKTKVKGNIKKSERVISKGIQILNGENAFRFNFIPINLIEYENPETSHPFAKGERFALWIKLEDSSFKQIQEQLKKGLREITIWFDEENRNKLKEFLK